MADRPSRQQITLPIQWNIRDFTPTYYATNIVVQATDHEVVLSFFEAFPPLLVGTTEEIQDKASSLDRVQADSLVRVVVALDRMPAFVQALQSMIEQRFASDEDENEA